MEFRMTKQLDYWSSPSDSFWRRKYLIILTTVDDLCWASLLFLELLLTAIVALTALAGFLAYSGLMLAGWCLIGAVVTGSLSNGYLKSRRTYIVLSLAISCFFMAYLYSSFVGRTCSVVTPRANDFANEHVLNAFADVFRNVGQAVALEICRKVAAVSCGVCIALSLACWAADSLLRASANQRHKDAGAGQ
jgi:hypothetical protein